MVNRVSTIGTTKFKGYTSNPRGVKPEYLSQPSVNALINTDGVAETRMGFEALSIDLNQANKTPTCFYQEQYDLTWFAAGTKVYYYDWTRRELIDTGVSLTTGTTSRFDEYAGDVYLTNTTDGIRRFVVGRLNGAASSGAASVTVDPDMDARMTVTEVDHAANGNLRIRGTAEAFANAYQVAITGAADNGAGLVRITTGQPHELATGQLVLTDSVGGVTGANGTFTVTVIDSTHFDLQSSTFSGSYTSGGQFTRLVNGVIRLTGTLSQNYADNDICLFVSDISSGREKFSKLTFWKERMTGIGSVNTSNADQPNATVYFGKFASATTLEDIIDFTYGSGGATREMVGKWGRITNLLATEDYLYVFKERGSYVVGAGDVIISGSGIGTSTPDLRSPIYGCANEDAAADMGNGEIAFITNNKRIMRIKISTDSGAPVVFPDESFDQDIQQLLRLMDDDQAGSHLFYHTGKRRLYAQVKIQSQWITLVFDNQIRAWQPPQTGKSFTAYFERKGTAYATDKTDDTIYQIDSSSNDNGSPIECCIASGVFEIGDAMVDECSVTGFITQPTTINVKVPVDSGTAQIKSIKGSSFSYGTGSMIQGVMLGGQTLGGTVSSDIAGFDKTFGIFPSEGHETQFVSTSFGDSHCYAIKSYSITYRLFPSLSRSE